MSVNHVLGEGPPVRHSRRNTASRPKRPHRPRSHVTGIQYGPYSSPQPAGIMTNQTSALKYLRPRPSRVFKWVAIQGVIIGLYVLAYITMREPQQTKEDDAHLVQAKVMTQEDKPEVKVAELEAEKEGEDEAGEAAEDESEKKPPPAKKDTQQVAPQAKPPPKKPVARPTKIPVADLPLELQVKPPVQHAKMVILFAYMRGGSSVLGEMFNQNPSALYLFEPLDGTYSSMYGLPLKMSPLDITHNYDMIPRRYPITEKEYVAHLLYNMLACNVEQMTTEQLVHPNLYKGHKSTSYTFYGRCMKKQTPETFRWRCIPFKQTCDKEAQSDKKLHRCDRLGQIFVPVDGKVMPGDYTDCVKNLENITKKCLGLMEEECQRYSVRTLKSIRLTGDIIKALLSLHHSVKVIYFLRDPRGIVASRMKEGLLSVNSKNDSLKEIKMLCEDMVRDLKIIAPLAEQKPKSILIQYYENFALDPEKTATEAYQFAEIYMPPKVIAHLHNITHATSDTAAYETARANATATAFAWRRTLPKPLIGKMTEVCRDFFDEAQKLQPLYKP